MRLFESLNMDEQRRVYVALHSITTHLLWLNAVKPSAEQHEKAKMAIGIVNADLQAIVNILTEGEGRQ